ncbi:hypothetical protein DL96DRAFT_1823448 [Flagelloscypha sp. PMI_526]|nr:hypothetical protein DL96DRAFT_1823448 [Flagelloscypha sp. PMI_526]
MTTRGLSTQLDECTHHSSLWFPDGNIVLRAGLVLFKVYKGILAAKCTVFANMVSIPQPKTGQTDQQYYGDCPLVCLDDDEEEVTAFLTLLFDSMSLRNIKQCSFKQSVGILRLSHKYDSPPLMSYAGEALDAVVPLTLESFSITEPPYESLDWMLPWAAYVAIATRSTSQLSMANIVFKSMERLQRALIFDFISSLCQTSDMCIEHACHQRRFGYISIFVKAIGSGDSDAVLCAIRSYTGKPSHDSVVESPLGLQFKFGPEVVERAVAPGEFSEVISGEIRKY